MDIFPRMGAAGHENVMFLQHRESGLKAILAIHDSSLGPAIGGIRCRMYPDESSAIRDALRFAEDTSLSTALCDCDAGGGRVLLLCSPEQKTEHMLRALGAYIQGLGGRFIGTLDLGITPEDVAILRKETSFVAGMARNLENDGLGGNTARGVYLGMKAAARVVFGTDNLKGRKIGIQGMGKVGLALSGHLVAEGAQVYVSDLLFERIKVAKDHFPGLEIIQPREFLNYPVEILSPCAEGGILTSDSIQHLSCKIIAGPAGNQLASDDVAKKLADRNIWFVPDFMLNAGETIMVHAEMTGQPADAFLPRLEKASLLVEKLFLHCRERRLIPYEVAKEWAFDRMKNIRTLKKIYRPK